MKRRVKISCGCLMSFVFVLLNSFSWSQAYTLQIDTTTYRTLSDSDFKVGDRILVRDVVFSQPGGARLLDKSFNSLDSIGRFLQNHPNLQVEIALHSDQRGNAEFSLKSTDKQAESVKKSLIRRNGINEKRLSSRGYGRTEPIISIEQINTQTDKAEFERLHAINRRMELRIVGFWDDCFDMSYLKSSCSLLNWPIESRHIFSKNDRSLIQLSCACELKDFEIFVLNRWGKTVHESSLKLGEQNKENSGVLHSFEIPTHTLQVGSYMYFIRRKGADKTEDVLMQGHFHLVE